MKIKFNIVQGKGVISYKNANGTLSEALDLLARDEVISITVTKQTPT